MRRLLLLLLATGLAFGSLAHPVAAASKRLPRRLDGVFVAPHRANPRLVAVMIDGHSMARPQAGLDKASVVYETLAEGGIPRFMAVYARTDMPLVGPVRSARPYYVRYAAEYPAAIAHFGGSPDAQELIKKLKLRNIEGVNGPTARFFFRKGFGVHSAFTNGQLLRKAMRNKPGPRAILNYRPWQFSSDPPKKQRPRKKSGVVIRLNSNSLYEVRYDYSRRRNAYLRSTAGVPQFDPVSRTRLTAKNVILLFVPKEKVLDYKARIELKTVGRGKGVLLQNGRAVTINWRKPSAKARIIFTTENGKEVSLVRGSIWITVVPKGRSYRLF